MSKGSPVVKCRLPHDLLAEVEADLEKRNANAKGEVWTLSHWLVAAIRQALAKRKRSREKGGSKYTRSRKKLPRLTDQAER